LSTSFDIAVVGATGLVGETILNILAQRDFPLGRLIPLASARSAGREVQFRGKPVPVQVLDDFDFKDVSFALFSAGASVSATHAPRAVEAGAWVIDNTSQFRYDPAIPLVVPEVNGHVLEGHRGIIANPNCSTIQMVMALAPIHRAVGIERINVASYQAVSGAGRSAVKRLRQDAEARLAGKEPVSNGNELSVAFDAIPHIDVFLDNGYTKEEMKMVWETRKILEDERIMVNPTAVRVPVFQGHSEAIHIETRTKVTVPEVQKLLNSTPGVQVFDERAPGGYPTAVSHGANRDSVFVGRIREDISHPRGINLWVVADNLRKGAALNSVQIAETLANI
jgi:aspartate-semialdehyde dehydrogenase